MAAKKLIEKLKTACTENLAVERLKWLLVKRLTA